MTELYAITKDELILMREAAAEIVSIKSEMFELRKMITDSFDVLISTAEAAGMLGIGKPHFLRLVAYGRKMPRHAAPSRLIVQNGKLYVKNYSPLGWGRFSKADIMEWRRIYGSEKIKQKCDEAQANGI